MVSGKKSMSAFAKSNDLPDAKELKSKLNGYGSFVQMNSF